MATTFSVQPLGPGFGDDLDGTLAVGVEALRQRIVQAIRFRFGTWFLRRGAGLDYDLLIGHRLSPELVAGAINAIVRAEGGDEVLGLVDVEVGLDENRTMTYAAVVQTVYGDLQLSEAIP